MSTFGGATGFDRVFVYVLLSGIIVDRATKAAAESLLRDRPDLPVIPGLMDLHYVRNAGGLFGVFDSMSSTVRIVALRLVPALLALALSIAYAQSPADGRLLRGSLVFMVTGTVANLLDRLKHDAVIDFINLRLGAHSPWLTINVADIYLVVGVVLLVWHLGSVPAPRNSEKS